MDLNKMYARVRLFYKDYFGEYKTRSRDETTFLKALYDLDGFGYFNSTAIAIKTYDNARSMMSSEIQKEVSNILNSIDERGFILKGTGRETQFLDYRNVWLEVPGFGKEEKQPTIVPGPRKPLPQLPVEVWNTKQIDTSVAMAAMRDLCKGQMGAGT